MGFLYAENSKYNTYMMISFDSSVVNFETVNYFDWWTRI